jgi:non-ribosomal peptide synthetase-like protein
MHTDERTATRVRLLHAIFEQQARSTPAAIALEVPPQRGDTRRVRLSYAELNDHAESLAAAVSRFVSGECIVAVLLPRAGPELFIAQLAIMKAGAAWTCIEPGCAAERLRFLLADSCAVAVVAFDEQRAALVAAGFPGDRVVCPVQGALARPLSPRHAPAWLTPETLAYVIYTSGTTGHPKGVMIEHRSIANLVWSDAEYFDLHPGDRIAQSTSCAYDSSVEEVWLAWGTGATVVVVDDERVRSGPDLLPWLREERISVWCPAPTLLRMAGGEDPRLELPGVRLLYVGGEELTADIAQRWAPGRRLENGYGPTECTVTVVRAPVRAGEPVTIGRPVTGHRAFVVNAELDDVPEGETGELCIAGEGVARGYLGREDLTRERFVEHARMGRVYRTGDLVRRLPGGELAYLGRADTQVKIRGHRIELTAIESELCRCEDVLEAACRVQQNCAGAELVAYVVTLAAREPDREALVASLRRTLPEAMLPARIARLDALPRNALSGKLDRNALPELAHEPQRTVSGRTARTVLEQAVAAAFAHQLPLAHAPGIDADFFLDLGGNSLLAAQVISELRRSPLTAALTVRDLYEARTIAELAARVSAAPLPTAAEPTVAAPAGTRVSPHAAWTVVAQTAFLTGALLAVVNVAWLMSFRVVPALARALGSTPFLLLLPSLVLIAALLWTFVAAGLTVLAKRVLIGRYRAGRHAYLGSMYLRHWIVSQFARSLPWDLLESTGLNAALLRALGARIGTDVHVHRGVALHHGGWDLLEIGDGAALGRDVALGLVTYDRQQLVFAPVTIGADATLDTRARMAPGSRLGDGAFLCALAWLADCATVPAGERWDGVPACPAGMAPPAPVGASEPSRPSAWHTILLLAAKAIVAQVAFVPAMALAAVVLSAWRAGGEASFSRLPLGPLVIAVMAGYALSLPLEALLCRLLGRVRPGVYPLHGATAMSVLLKERLVETANVALSGTLGWPLWLRWAGMRVGRRCEISTLMEVTPELVEIADDCFFADGIYLGRPLVHRGHLHCSLTTFEHHTFLGNHAVIPAGAQLPANILLGVCTVAEPERIRSDSAWFGQPAFELPRRERVEADDRLTFSPSPIRVANRVMWELLRLVLPVLPVLLVAFWATTLPGLALRWPGAAFHLGVLPSSAIATAVFLCALTLVSKWLLLGRMRAERHVLWSCWCCRWDFVYEVWSAYARPLIETLEGTPLVAWWLRAMGARIGRRVVIGTSLAQLVDPDMLEIGDDATVSCHMQLHSFEDRVLKLGRSRIGNGSTIAAGALLLYGAEIGDHAHVAEQSVVMKHEHLLAGARYEGAPTRPARAGGSA